MYLRRFPTSFVLLLMACACAIAEAAQKGSDLYLLAATPTDPSTGRYYPAALYRVDLDRKLKLVRQIVPPVSPMQGWDEGGVAAVLDDMESRIYVLFPSLNPTTVSIIHKDQATVNDEVTFDPVQVFGIAAVGVSAGAAGASSLLLPVIKGVSGPEDI